jgi:hypothetical protein
VNAQSSRRAKASSSSHSSALKTVVKDVPANQMAIRPPRQVVVRSPSSPLSPASQLSYFAECEKDGRILQWGRDFIQVQPLVKAFKVQFPMPPDMHDYEILPIPLTAKIGDADFQKYVLDHASESMKRALRKWFDAKNTRNKR